jgi:cytochrome c-type biogenesis protein CcmE
MKKGGQVGKIRLGGMVAYGSVKRKGTLCYFRLTDHFASLEVAYKGLLPHLFHEGGEVLLEGTFYPHQKLFLANQVLIKHDEVYAPSSSCAPSSLPRNPKATR